MLKPCRSAILLVTFTCAAVPAQKQVAVVGASVSAGLAWHDYERFSPDPNPVAYVEKQFGRGIERREYDLRTDNVSVAKALQRMAKDQSKRVPNYSRIFFGKPDDVIGDQLDDAIKKDKWQLVIGLDLLVWFGYGDVRRPPGNLTKDKRLAARAEQRYEMQEAGFELLEHYLDKTTDTVFVIGDYPDLPKASKALLRADQRPTSAVLAELNRRFHAWAAKHDRVVVYPMHRIVKSAIDNTLEVQVGGKTRRLRDVETMQFDGVHPNKIGMAVLLGELRDVVAEKAPHVLGCLPKIPEFEKTMENLGVKLEDLEYLTKNAR